MDRDKQEHPAFGMVSVSRVSGETSLFGVDYPQGHFITLQVSRGAVERNLGTEWFYQRNEMLQLAMSEVQWARLVASINTSGVPCTLQRTIDEQGQCSDVPPPPSHMADAVVQKNEVAAVGKKISDDMRETSQLIGELMKPNAKINKAKIGELQVLMDRAHQNLRSNLPFYVSSAQEAVEKATEQGKAEVSAYADHVVSELGRTELQKKLSDGGIMLSVSHVSEE